MTSTAYRPTLRPASCWTLPDGIDWEYVEAPADLTTRPDIPRSLHRYGIVRLSRPLTDGEMDRFGLVPA